MPRNLHFIKFLSLFSCQASLNHTLGSNGLNISVKMGRLIGLGVTREGFIAVWKEWAEFGDEVMGEDLEKEYWRWG